MAVPSMEQFLLELNLRVNVDNLHEIPSLICKGKNIILMLLSSRILCMVYYMFVKFLQILKLN